MKLRAMISSIIDKKFFGNVAAYVRVVKFQKRGLPHVLFIFSPDWASKQSLMRPEDVCDLECAEFPSVKDQ